MPRYFVTIYDRIITTDDEGVEVPDLKVLGTLLRETLAGIVRDEPEAGSVFTVKGEATDESGKVVMLAEVQLKVKSA